MDSGRRPEPSDTFTIEVMSFIHCHMHMLLMYVKGGVLSAPLYMCVEMVCANSAIIDMHLGL